eukprot:1159304-Pelagomonas_calceolata.AAC.1
MAAAAAAACLAMCPVHDGMIGMQLVGQVSGSYIANWHNKNQSYHTFCRWPCRCEAHHDGADDPTSVPAGIPAGCQTAAAALANHPGVLSSPENRRRGSLFICANALCSMQKRKARMTMYAFMIRLVHEGLCVLLKKLHHRQAHHGTSVLATAMLMNVRAGMGRLPCPLRPRGLGERLVNAWCFLMVIKDAARMSIQGNVQGNLTQHAPPSSSSSLLEVVRGSVVG